MIYKFLVKSKRFGQGNMQKEKFTFYKKGISYVLLLFLINTVSPCFAEVQKDFYISAEEILQTQGTPPDVSFTNKIAREIKIMEKRHFSSVNSYDSDKYRIAKLEEHLLGRTWEFLPVEERMKKLKLASGRKVMSGTAIPASLRKAGYSPKRIANDSTPVYDNDDNVGLIDGFLRLINKDAFDAYNQHKKRMYEQYDYE